MTLQSINKNLLLFIDIISISSTFNFNIIKNLKVKFNKSYKHCRIKRKRKEFIAKKFRNF